MRLEVMSTLGIPCDFTWATPNYTKMMGWEIIIMRTEDNAEFCRIRFK